MRHTYLVWAIVPILPFLASLVLLEFVFGETLSAEAWSESKHDANEARSFFDELPFFNALIVYITIGFFHVALCIAGSAYLVAKIFACPREVQRCVWTVIAVLVFLLIASSFISSALNGLGALELTYRNVCWVVSETGVAPHLMPAACNAGEISLFAWLATLPYLSGLLAAICAAGVACTAALPMAAGTDAARDRVKTIELAFKLTVILLVTTTLSLMLFHQLPLAVDLPDTDSEALMKQYGQGMAMFWGTVCTLTLIAIFGPAVLMLEGVATNQRGAQRRTDTTTLSIRGIRDQITKVLAVLAPFIIGSLGPALEILTSVFR